MLTDPNMDPDYLGMLVMMGVNNKKFKPSVTAMKERYYQMFRGKGAGLAATVLCGSRGRRVLYTDYS